MTRLLHWDQAKDKADLQGETSGHPLREVGSRSNSITEPREKAALTSQGTPTLKPSHGLHPACSHLPARTYQTPLLVGGCDTGRREGGDRWEVRWVEPPSPEKVHHPRPALFKGGLPETALCIFGFCLGEPSGWQLRSV